jgi:hypothetical protein
MYKVDKVLEQIKQLKVVAGRNTEEIGKQLGIRGGEVRYIIQCIKKSQCNGASKEFDKYLNFQYRDAFSKKDNISIIFKNN